MSTVPLFTIGYEGSRVGAVTAALAAAGVALLLDVRAIAASRKPGFSKRQLAAALDEAGIAYLHLRALGTPKPGRQAARAGHVAEMERLYAAHLETDAARAALIEATALVTARPACLLCFEASHLACHRNLLAQRLSAATRQPLIHLAPVQV